jgi:predicted RecB family nuclease
MIQLPKGYLSYSQVQLWLHDKARYKALYFDNRDDMRIENSGMVYGKQVAEALENEVETGDLLTDAAMLLLPKYDIRDKEIYTILTTKQGEIPLLGRPDMMDSVSKSFYEIKTGKVAWTQNKADKHLQLPFYAMIIYLTHKVIPSAVSLVWIETQDTDEGIKPTGKVESFPVKIGMKEILECMALTSKVAMEIEQAYATHQPDPNLKWGEEECGECQSFYGHRAECTHCE